MSTKLVPPITGWRWWLHPLLAIKQGVWRLTTQDCILFRVYDDEDMDLIGVFPDPLMAFYASDADAKRLTDLPPDEHGIVHITYQVLGQIRWIWQEQNYTMSAGPKIMVNGPNASTEIEDGPPWPTRGES